MSLYPPLTPENIRKLNETILSIAMQRQELLQNWPLRLVEAPGDEDTLTRQVANLRGAIGALDLELFRLFGLVHRLKESNLPTIPRPTTTATPRPRATLEDLEGMF